MLKVQKEENKNMKAKNINLMSLDQFIEKHYGKKGTAKRDKFEVGYRSFKTDAMRLILEKNQEKP